MRKYIELGKVKEMLFDADISMTETETLYKSLERLPTIEIMSKHKYRNYIATINHMPTIEISEDCISKAYLEQEIENQIMPAIDREMYWRGWNNALGKVVELIEDAPSATTEQSSMVGKWQITDAYPHNVYCSECHKKFAQTHWAVWEDGSLPRNYCPNCGAKMKGADE